MSLHRLKQTFFLTHKGRQVGLPEYETLTGAMAGKRAFLRDERPRNGRVKIWSKWHALEDPRTITP